MTTALETIGSAELAKTAIEMDIYDVDSGWKYLGEGSFRRTYLAPDGFVYKVNKYHRYSKGNGYNHYENEAFVDLHRRGFLWVPRFTLYRFGDDDIMVVQFLRDTMGKDYKKEENKKRSGEISHHVVDSWGDNSGVDPNTGLLYIRDGGNGLR